MARQKQYCANDLDAEEKALRDEIKAFRKYEPSFIPCVYNKDKADTFRKRVERENMEYEETTSGIYQVFLRTDGYV